MDELNLMLNSFKYRKKKKQQKVFIFDQFKDSQPFFYSFRSQSKWFNSLSQVVLDCINPQINSSSPFDFTFEELRYQPWLKIESDFLISSFNCVRRDKKRIPFSSARLYLRISITYAILIIVFFCFDLSECLVTNKNPKTAV